MAHLDRVVKWGVNRVSPSGKVTPVPGIDCESLLSCWESLGEYARKMAMTDVDRCDYEIWGVDAQGSPAVRFAVQVSTYPAGYALRRSGAKKA